MKILVVGDFHGKFPKKIDKIIRKDKIDLLVSIGDYLPFFYRDLWFKHCYHTDVELWEVIGKKKYRKLIEKDLSYGEDVLKKLNSLGIPVITVLGNVDYPLADDVMDEKKPKGKRYWKEDWERPKKFINILKKYRNIHRFDYSYFKFGDFVFIGARGHTFPGHVKSKGYRKHRKILDNLFKKFKKKKVIFVGHNVPFDTRLDKIGKKAHELVKGKHYGSKLIRRVIDKHQPVLYFGGHIHESKGKQKIRKTLAFNVGSVAEGGGVVVEVSEKGRLGKVKFIK